MQLADAMASVEAARALVRQGVSAKGTDGALLRAKGRLYAREVGRLVLERALVTVSGGAETTPASLEAFAREAGFGAVHSSQAGAVADMDAVAEGLRST
jgi:hypothetical protein